MATCLLPTVEIIHDTFVSEITQLGGRVTDDYGVARVWFEYGLDKAAFLAFPPSVTTPSFVWTPVLSALVDR